MGSMNHRSIASVQGHLAASDATALLVSTPENIFYLTGFQGIAPSEREASVLVTKSDCFLFLPRMYTEAARVLPLIQSGEVTLVVDEERDGLLRLPLSRVHHDDHLLVEETDLRLHEYRMIEAQSPCPVHAVAGMVEQCRVRKDATELETIATAVSLTDQVFAAVVSMLQDRVSTAGDQLPTEHEVVRFMAETVDRLGGDGFGFDPIVASGPGSSQPHYHPTNRRVRMGEPVLIDIGVRYRGYTGDMTRVIFLGSAPDEFRERYQLVHETCLRSCEQVRPGVRAGDLHLSAVTQFAAAAVEDHFIHGLGHGVGLNIHEQPFFRVGRQTPLEPGMVITIEPGLYWEGEYGIRIEQYLVVTKDGATILSESSTELIEILPDKTSYEER